MANSLPDASLLLNTLDEPAVLIRAERILFANQAAETILGSRIKDKDVRLAIRHPAALDAIRSGENAKVEVVGIGAPDRPWELNVHHVADGCILVRLVDRSAARAAERMRVDFVANASHELRTPLASISGYAETLADETEIDPDMRRRFGGLIHNESRRMLRIVEDLLSLSRIEADRFVPPQEMVSATEIVSLAAEHIRLAAEERGCILNVEIDDDPPPLLGDFGQLLQMMDNLAGNALRYGCGAAMPAIRMGAKSERDGVILFVADNGEGIPQEHLPRITERFYRVDPARSRNSGGTGLGLAIVKHIVERHRGTLDIRSHQGEGTEVRVRLPVTRSAS